MSSYDYPFNERIRTFLRVEDLFAKVLYNIESSHEYQHHSALLTLLQILDIVDRLELRSDLLLELSRQRMGMEALQGNPAIASQKLEDILHEIDAASEALRAENTKLGQILRTNEWLMSIKQRAGIPGGVCEFDLPSYHFWLGLGEDRRKTDLKHWLSTLVPMHDAIMIVLRVLRGSGSATQLVATNGIYQQMLSGTKPAQMLRVDIPNALTCFPEVSANKYAINIRFNILDFTQKPQVFNADVPFTLTLCNL